MNAEQKQTVQSLHAFILEIRNQINEKSDNFPIANFSKQNLLVDFDTLQL